MPHPCVIVHYCYHSPNVSQITMLFYRSRPRLGESHAESLARRWAMFNYTFVLASAISDDSERIGNPVATLPVFGQRRSRGEQLAGVQVLMECYH